ncbi:adenylate/guanylate cyclase domain-containing protein, partial [Treponema pallidum]
LHSNAELNNLAAAENFAAQIKGEFEAIATSAKSFVSLGLRSGARMHSRSALSKDFFSFYPRIGYIGVGGVAELWNGDFFKKNQLRVADARRFLADNAQVISTLQTAPATLNAAPWFKAQIIAIVAPFEVDGATRNVVVIFSADVVQHLLESGASSGTMYAVTWAGNSLYHPEYSLNYSNINLQDSPVVRDLRESTQLTKQISFIGTDNKRYFGAFAKQTFGKFAIVLETPMSVVYQAVYYAIILDGILTGMVLLASILLVWFIAQSITRPILTLVGATHAISSGQFLLDIKPSSKDEIGLLTETFVSMGRGLAERERMKEAFGKFVNRDIAEKAMKGELALGGERKTATIFFSDVRSFTEMSEKLPPEDVVEFLNEYMSCMVDCIEQTGGVVDKFIGDAIMAIWGAPVSLGSARLDALQSMKAVFLMRESLIQLNEKRVACSKPRIGIGCGVNTGSCVAGQIGSSKRMEYTVIGDAVNTASRIEALNKPFGTDFLISENTYELVKDMLIVEKMPPITVKGKREPLNVYAAINLKGHDGPQTLDELRALLSIEKPGLSADPDFEEKKCEVI